MSTRGGVVIAKPERAGGNRSSGKRERSSSGTDPLPLGLSPGLDKLGSFLSSLKIQCSIIGQSCWQKTYLVPPLLVTQFSAARRLDKHCYGDRVRGARRPRPIKFIKVILPNPGILDALQYLFRVVFRPISQVFRLWFWYQKAK